MLIRYIPAQLKMAIQAEAEGDQTLANTHLHLALHADEIFEADKLVEKACEFERAGDFDQANDIFEAAIDIIY